MEHCIDILIVITLIAYCYHNMLYNILQKQHEELHVLTFFQKREALFRACDSNNAGLLTDDELPKLEEKLFHLFPRLGKQNGELLHTYYSGRST